MTYARSHTPTSPDVDIVAETEHPSIDGPQPEFEVDTSQYETPVLSAAEGMVGSDEDFGVFDENDASNYYEPERGNGPNRLGPEEVDATLELPACGVVLGGLSHDEDRVIQSFTKHSAGVSSLRQQFIQLVETDRYHQTKISDALHEADYDAGVAQTQSAIQASGRLIVDMDEYVTDLTYWRDMEREHGYPRPDPVAKELLARKCDLLIRQRFVHKELRLLIDPKGEDKSGLERQIVGAAESYQEYYQAMKVYIDAYQEAFEEDVESVEALQVYAAYATVASSAMFMKGVAGMSSRWQVVAAGKLAGVPGPMGVVDSIPWKDIIEARAWGEATQACLTGGLTERQVEICTGLGTGGNQQAFEELSKRAERLRRLSEQLED